MYSRDVISQTENQRQHWREPTRSFCKAGCATDFGLLCYILIAVLCRAHDHAVKLAATVTEHTDLCYVLKHMVEVRSSLHSNLLSIHMSAGWAVATYSQCSVQVDDACIQLRHATYAWAP